MCYHFIGFHAYDRLPKPMALWRCSTCGRESRAPIDCCVQPSFAVIPRPGIGHAVRQWLRAIVRQAVTGLAAILPRHRSSEAGICIPDVPAACMDSEVADPSLSETDIETAELEETTHASL